MRKLTLIEQIAAVRHEFYGNMAAVTKRAETYKKDIDARTANIEKAQDYALGLIFPAGIRVKITERDSSTTIRIVKFVRSNAIHLTDYIEPPMWVRTTQIAEREHAVIADRWEVVNPVIEEKLEELPDQRRTS